MSYVIAIPSYKREFICNNKTLKSLADNNINPSLIDVFVIEEEYEKYEETLDASLYNKIIIGKKGLVEQREFIERYYKPDTNIIFLDDDITLIDLSLTAFINLHHFFIFAFEECREKNAFIWGVYPVFNPYFRDGKNDVTYNSTYIVGAFYGIINRKCDFLKLEITREGNKEDVERSIKYWLKDGVVVRFNKVGFKTTYYGTDGGGLGKLEDRIEPAKNATIALNEKYPKITKIKIRKNGIYELVILKDNPIIPLKPIDPSNDDLLEVYNSLENITVKYNTNENGRCKTFGPHRAIVMGLVTARVSRNYGLSEYSRKYPALYDSIVKLGKSIVPFEFTTIHVNHNVICPPHVDGKNIGKSVIVSFGDYEGCNLCIKGFGEFDTNCKPLMFNGSKLLHWNTPKISGNKYSLVFYNYPKHN